MISSKKSIIDQVKKLVVLSYYIMLTRRSRGKQRSLNHHNPSSIISVNLEQKFLFRQSHEIYRGMENELPENGLLES